jgi:hypothetical protein
MVHFPNNLFVTCSSVSPEGFHGTCEAVQGKEWRGAVHVRKDTKKMEKAMG